MKDTYELINDYLRAEQDVKSIEEVLKMRKQTRDKLAGQLAEHWSENQLGKVEVRGQSIKAAHQVEYNIQGGKKSTEKRTEVIAFLEELGFADKVHTFKEMHANDLKKALDGLDDEMLAGLIKRKLISVYSKPVVQIRKLKGKSK